MFGSSRGLNDENKKLVDSILRDAQREEPVVQQVVQAPQWQQPLMYNQGPRFIPPQFPWHPPQQGVCNICQLPGHFARECPTQRGLQPYAPFPGMKPFRPPQAGEVEGDLLVQLGVKHFPQEGEAGVEEGINERTSLLF